MKSAAAREKLPCCASLSRATLPRKVSPAKVALVEDPVPEWRREDRREPLARRRRHFAMPCSAIDIAIAVLIRVVLACGLCEVRGRADFET